MSDPNRMKFHGEEFYVKSIEEMGRIFPDHPEALSNTLKVVESVEDVGIELGKTRLPNFPKPEGYTADQYLREQCRSEEHTSELQSRQYLVCRLLLEKKPLLNSSRALYLRS